MEDKDKITVRLLTLVFVLGLMLGIILGMFTIICKIEYTEIQSKKHIPEIKPCKCLTYHQLSYYSTKYEIYMDSLNYASKKNRPRLEDSVRRYGQILRQNDNP